MDKSAQSRNAQTRCSALALAAASVPGAWPLRQVRALDRVGVSAGSSTGRLRSLDALRGVASLWVVLHHAWAASAVAVASVSLIKFTPLRFLLGARPPVIFFFVLSGFVLTLICRGPHAQSYPAYLIRRICRIYLPFAAVILLSALAAVLLASGPVPGASVLINDMWNDVSLGSLVCHLLMTGIDGQTGFDPPMWSLVQEMRMSVVFPALLLVVAPLRWQVALLLAAALFMTSWAVLRGLGQDAIGYYSAVSGPASIALTVFFVLPFVAGILVALNREWLVARVVRIGAAWRGMLWLGVMAAIALPSFSPGMDAVYSLAASGVIVLTLSGSYASAVLTTPLLQWLGRISYSLYLVHLPVLAVMAGLLGRQIPFGAIALLAPCVSLALATVVHALIERPAMRFGRNLAAGKLQLRTTS